MKEINKSLKHTALGDKLERIGALQCKWRLGEEAVVVPQNIPLSIPDSCFQMLFEPNSQLNSRLILLICALYKIGENEEKEGKMVCVDGPMLYAMLCVLGIRL